MILNITNNMMASFHQKFDRLGISKRTLIKIAVLAPVIFFVGKEIFNRTNFIYNVWQNGKIEQIDCQLDKTTEFFEEAAKSGKAADLYCYAKRLINTSSRDKENVIKARNLSKEAYNKGLKIAKQLLCQSEMFFKDESKKCLDSQFCHICCSTPPKGSFKALPTCPWRDFPITQICNSDNLSEKLQNLIYEFI